jgi:hypothetical protein
MNKKALMTVNFIILMVLVSLLSYHIAKGTVVVVPEKSLPEIDGFEVSKALTVFEMTGEEKMRKDYSVLQYLNKMESREGEYWDEIDELQKEIDELEREFWYRHDVSLQLDICYTLQEYGRHFFGYVLWPLGEPHQGSIWIALSADYESEIRDLKNEAELLQADRIKKEFELETLYQKRDMAHIPRIKELRKEIDVHEYGYKRYVLLSTVVPYKLKKGESLEITPSWKEGEHYLAPERDHVWVGMYSTSAPGITNFLGYYATDTFTPDMGYYWEEALKKYLKTKSIRIKWIYAAEGQRIVWEGNKNKNEEWYTFAEYPGDPQEGTYTVVNMSLLNYPEYQQYYVVE